MDDFELFKTKCQKWIDFFGLKNYKVKFKYEELDKGIGANVLVDDEATLAIITFNKNKSEGDISEWAFHEVMHILLAKMNFLATSRYIEKDALTIEEEHVVRILENTVYPKLQEV